MGGGTSNCCQNKIAPSKEEENIFQLPNNGTDTISDTDALLAAKLACVNSLSYNCVHPECHDQDFRKSFEPLMVNALRITMYSVWYRPFYKELIVGKLLSNDQKHSVGEKIGGACCITGTINDIAPNYPGPSLVICFRGTQSVSDMISDASCITSSQFHSTVSKQPISQTGSGFLNHYTSLLHEKNSVGKNFLQVVVDAARQFKCRILITGHSLGAAMATLCAADICTDYDSEFDVKLFTFGCPRVYESPGHKFVENLPFTNARFVNDGDYIAVTGDIQGYHHTGRPHGFSSTMADWRSISLADLQNFPLPPSLFNRSELLDTFAKSGASEHRLTTPTGYIPKLFGSATYKYAIGNLDPDLKKSFEILAEPIEILIKRSS